MMDSATLNAWLEGALTALAEKHGVRLTVPTPLWRKNTDTTHGDYSSNVALRCQKAFAMSGVALAEQLNAHLQAHTPLGIARTEAAAGFINVYLESTARIAVITRIFEHGAKQRTKQDKAPQKGERVLVEFVSANPTGPLHIGHGRGAAFGDTIARLLEGQGHRVTREYYVNDAGRQMNILAASIWLRMMNVADMPAGLYQGAYVKDMAAQLRPDFADMCTDALPAITHTDSADAVADAYIAHLKTTYPKQFPSLVAAGGAKVLAGIDADLQDFGVAFDAWFSEGSLLPDALGETLAALKASKYAYQQGGAWWLKTTAFEDTKDRVIVRADGVPTYFATDIAYHATKFARDFDRLINVFGADHHGYIARLKAALTILGHPVERLEFCLVQFASLVEEGETLAMSTRSGEFITLAALTEKVGTSAARFFYNHRSIDQHMMLDVSLAREQSNKNPVFYVQYAHARAGKLLKTAAERGYAAPSGGELERLTCDAEVSLLMLLEAYPIVLTKAATQRAPNQLTNFLYQDLATAFHKYYTTTPLLVEDSALREARLSLVHSVRVVLADALATLGVDAPEEM